MKARGNIPVESRTYNLVQEQWTADGPNIREARSAGSEIFERLSPNNTPRRYIATGPEEKMYEDNRLMTDTGLNKNVATLIAQKSIQIGRTNRTDPEQKKSVEREMAAVVVAESDKQVSVGKNGDKSITTPADGAADNKAIGTAASAMTVLPDSECWGNSLYRL